MLRPPLLIVACLLCLPAVAADWRQFRGPNGDGSAVAAKNLPHSWGELFDPPAWKTELPGLGWSSPIVIGGRIWVTASESTSLPAAAAASKLSKHKYGEEVFQTDASVKLFAIELDAANGKPLRRIDLTEVDDPTPIHVINTYASPTPVSDGKRLYCHFGSLATVAVTLETGKVLWKKRLLVDDITGPGSSPVLCDGRLILVRDGSDKQYVVALDSATGDVIWRRERPEIEVQDDRHRRSFSTPLVIHDGERKQVVAPAAQWVVSYDPSSGQELWKARFADGHAVVPRPVYSKGVVYVCSGYPKSKLAAIRVDGAGDVSETHVKWTYDRQVPLIASPVVVGGEIYFISTIGVATCLDASTGERLWQERLPGNHASSPLYADGKLYFTSKEGTTTVIRPGRTFEQIAKNQVYGQTMASMAVAGESLLIRTTSALYCLRKTN